ncbi:MAG: F420-dependent NADP oxidoreductase [Bacteroidales bacterium]|nr:F420-dependent NADP oxidoreductase [Bacteroidales bacterium]
MESIQKIVILGSGNVATHLARAFVSANINILQIYSPTLEHARELSETIGCDYTHTLNNLVSNADMYLFALTDSAVESVLKQSNWHERLCVHTAGSLPVDIFSRYTHTFGVLYPFQTFTKGVDISLNHVPFFIEASDETIKNKLTILAQKLSDKIYYADSQQRLSLHMAGVFACNFVNHMIAIAESILQESNLPADVLFPLINETLRKFLQIGAKNAQTGPALRNNREVIDKHLELLKEKPEWQKIYTFVSESIYKMYHS